MDEIRDISKKFKLYVQLANEEKKSGENQELLENETAAACERRWMRTIEKMSVAQRDELYEKYLSTHDPVYEEDE